MKVGNKSEIVHILPPECFHFKVSKILINKYVEVTEQRGEGDDEEPHDHGGHPEDGSEVVPAEQFDGDDDEEGHVSPSQDSEDDSVQEDNPDGWKEREGGG